MKHFFKNPDPKLRMLIISSDGLINHIKRSALQAGWLWKQCQHNVVHPCPTEWGCIRGNNMFIPRWCDKHEILDNVILTCTCQEKGKCRNCKCGKRELQCIEYCNCSRKCTKEGVP